MMHRWLTVAAYAAAWVVCGYYVLERYQHARHEFDAPERPDGCSGHVQIDFAGQWVMGRLFVEDGRRLYDRVRQRELVNAAFPLPGDADALMGWFVGDDPPAGDGIGGPLYPPVHGLLYAPLARLDPLTAYRVFQALSVGFAMLAGLAVSRATRGRVWWPVAVVGVLLFPGGRGGLDLGQNHFLTLAIFAGGWWAMSRERWLLGGAVWGLLALKPTWAVAFLPVLVLMGRWRSAAAMCGTAAGLILLTLPVVGLHGWLNWLAVGRMATELYGTSDNWVSFSRDLFGLPRRLWVDFKVPEAERGSPRAAVAGWCLWTIVASSTMLVYGTRRDCRSGGLAAGFLLLGAYLCCYRFMYYDAVLASLGVGLLVADRRTRRSWVPLTLLVALYGYENWLINFGVEVTVSRSAVDGRLVVAREGERLLTLGFNYRFAWDTAFLLGLWAWAGWRLLTPQRVEGGPDVGGPHQRLADQHG